MALFGFIALVVIGLYVVVQGVAIMVFTGGFTGRLSAIGAIVTAIGLALEYVAFINAPFTVAFN